MNISPDEIESLEERNGSSSGSEATKEIPIIVKSQSSSTAKVPRAFSKLVSNLPEQEAILLNTDMKILKENIPISELRDVIIETDEPKELEKLGKTLGINVQTVKELKPKEGVKIIFENE